MERSDRDVLQAAYSAGWLEGFSAVLWNLVGEKLADGAVDDYVMHVARVRDALGIEGVERWKS